MPIFTNVECEDKVQINDKIRISSSKSFVSVGTTAISVLTISPTPEVTGITVFNADASLRYLDWEYSAFEMDIDSSNNALVFSEGGSDLTATLTSGTYTLAELADEIVLQMESSGALDYEVDVGITDKLTISASGSFSIVQNALWNQLGFKVSTGTTLAGGSSYVGKRIRYLTKKIVASANSGGPSSTATKYVKLYSVDGDNLFSSDSDLVSDEPDILKWLPDGKNSFKNVHRRAQEIILSWLDEKGYTDVFYNKLSIDAIVDSAEVTEWSKYLTLSLIFKGIRNAVDDIFGEKAKDYEVLSAKSRNRLVLRLDLDGDGDIDGSSQESVRVSTISSARR